MRFEHLETYNQRVLALAEKYQHPQKHSAQVAALAGQLFAALAPLHGLPTEAATLLQHGAILHDIGYFVAHKGHHKHGAYLVTHDILLGGYPATERIMLSLLVRNHRKTPKDPAKLLSGQAAASTWKLCALLNVADGLDYAHDSNTQIVDVAVVEGKCISITVTGCDLGALRDVLRMKSKLMREVFGCKVRFVGQEQADASLAELSAADDLAPEADEP